jgi:hypothetical protein
VHDCLTKARAAVAQLAEYARQQQAQAEHTRAELARQGLQHSHQVRLQTAVSLPHAHP